jgi:hypothetical protein
MMLADNLMLTRRVLPLIVSLIWIRIPLFTSGLRSYYKTADSTKSEKGRTLRVSPNLEVRVLFDEIRNANSISLLDLRTLESEYQSGLAKLS